MSLTINTNVEAMAAQRNLSNTENALGTAMKRLSSGLRINSAADDVAGYAISERLEGQVNGLNQAQQNSQDAVSLAQTAQGSLNETEEMLQRVRELAVQYNNGTNTTSDREAIQSEVTQLTSEIERVGTNTTFNGVSLLSTASTISFQVGANDGEVIALSTINLKTSIGTISLGQISTIEKAINAVSAAASEFGAVQNRLQYTQNNLATYNENLSAAESSIKDVNMAEEMTTFTKEQVLQSAGVSVLAQAQQEPQAILQLLQS